MTILYKITTIGSLFTNLLSYHVNRIGCAPMEQRLTSKKQVAFHVDGPLDTFFWWTLSGFYKQKMCCNWCNNNKALFGRFETT